MVIYNNLVALNFYIKVYSISIVILTYRIAYKNKFLEVIFYTSLVLI
jgi:hypothetical protein